MYFVSQLNPEAPFVPLVLEPANALMPLEGSKTSTGLVFISLVPVPDSFCFMAAMIFLKPES